MDIADFVFPECIYESSSSASDDESSTEGNTNSQHAGSLTDMMDKISKHIEKFQNETFCEEYFFLLPHVVRSDNISYISTCLATYMPELLQTHKDSEANLKTVIRILYIILKAKAAEDHSMIAVPQNVAYELLELLMSENNSSAIPGLIECLKLHLRNQNDIELVAKMWAKVLQCISKNLTRAKLAQVLIEFSQYFQHINPNFYKHPEVIKFIQDLLLDNGVEQQSLGLQLLQMIIEILKRGQILCLWELDYCKEDILFWTTYLQLMKTLIRNSSVNLQPFIETLMNNGFKGVAYEYWMNVFFTKMLTPENNAFKRIAVEWILKRFKLVELNVNLLKLLLNTLNNFHLYNYETYFLPMDNIEKFLDCDCSELINSFAVNRWNSVPFHFWLRQLSIHKQKLLGSPTNELLTKIAQNVRSVEHTTIRRLTISVFEQLFDDILASMSLADHIAIIEHLYEIGDFCSHKRISVLLKKFHIFKTEITTTTFSKRLYDIICVNYLKLKKDDHLVLLLNTLTDLPKEKQGWLRLLLVFDTPAVRHSEITEFCRSNYDLELDTISELTLSRMSNEFIAKLGCTEDDELEFVHAKSLNFLADCRLRNFTDLAKLQVHVKDFIERGDYRAIEKLSEILKHSNHKLLSKDFDLLMKKIKDNLEMLKSLGVLNLIVKNLLDYCKRNYPDLQSEYAEKFLNLDARNVSIAAMVFYSDICVSEEFFKRGLLLGEPKQGEERMAEFYGIRIAGQHAIDLSYVRHWFIRKLRTNRHISNIVDHLLHLNKELSSKFDWEQELLLEHRQQMRIAVTISSLICEHNYTKLPCLNELWDILLEQEPRPSVRYLYEISTAMISPDLSPIKEQLKLATQYTEKCQLSVISVTYCFCTLRFNLISPKEFDEVVNLLMVLSMNLNAKSRLHAQMAVVLLLKKFLKEKKQLTHYETLRKTMKASIGDEFSKLSRNVRFIMPRIYKTKRICDSIFYITNEPYDEYKEPTPDIAKTIKESRILYAAEKY